MDPLVYRIVMSRPIPEKLIRNLAHTETLPPWACRRHVNGRITPALRETLPFVCHGYSNREIGGLLHYSEEAVKDRVKRLLAIYRARNRTHLAALAVARGDVEIE